MALEAFRIAVEYMTPVILLTDGYLANGAEPWRIPNIDSLPEIKVKHPKAVNGKVFEPYARDAKLARPWAIPGSAGLEHRIGGLEKRDISGEVCYVPENHENMIRIRQQKIDRIAETIPDLEVFGAPEGELLVLGWGSTYGAITSAVENCQQKGLDVSSAHLRYISPFPKNVDAVLAGFKKILIPEMNLGQLRFIVDARFRRETIGLNKVVGKPFGVGEVEAKIRELLS